MLGQVGRFGDLVIAGAVYRAPYRSSPGRCMHWTAARRQRGVMTRDSGSEREPPFGTFLPWLAMAYQGARECSFWIVAYAAVDGGGREPAPISLNGVSEASLAAACRKRS